jgi:histidine triad (HIT) family protein
MIRLCSGSFNGYKVAGSRLKVGVQARLWHPWLRRLIGWVFEYMSFAIPVQRLRETDTLIAFHHPRPSYKFHVLLVPKNAVATLMDVDPKDTEFFTDLYSTAQSLVDEFRLPAYRLIVNGGEYQDFPQLHFHLVSDVESKTLKV